MIGPKTAVDAPLFLWFCIEFSEVWPDLFLYFFSQLTVCLSVFQLRLLLWWALPLPGPFSRLLPSNLHPLFPAQTPPRSQAPPILNRNVRPSPVSTGYCELQWQQQELLLATNLCQMLMTLELPLPFLIINPPVAIILQHYLLKQLPTLAIFCLPANAVRLFWHTSLH